VRETGAGLFANFIRRIGFDIYRVNGAFGYVLLKHGIDFLLPLYRAESGKQVADDLYFKVATIATNGDITIGQSILQEHLHIIGSHRLPLTFNDI
jgi:hypothetical protein